MNPQRGVQQVNRQYIGYIPFIGFILGDAWIRKRSSVYTIGQSETTIVRFDVIVAKPQLFGRDKHLLR